MTGVFLRILDIGIAASYLIGVIFFLRLLLKKVPRTFFYILWCIVGIRLMVSVEITGSFSLVPDTGIEAYSETIVNSDKNNAAIEDNAVNEASVNNSGAVNNAGVTDNSDIVNNSGSVNNADNNAGNENLHNDFAGKTDTRGSSLVKVIAIVWAFGVAIMVAYLCISSLLLKRRLAQAVPLRENIYQSDRIESSFVFGMFRPSIYLPFSLGEEDMEYVIAHEKMHIRHRDYIVKIISFLVLSVYWFLPTVWIAWVLFCRDMEAFCDESVIRALWQEEKKNYATALLNCARKKEKLPVCPVAFGGAGLKVRIKNVLNYKKASFWVVTMLALVAVIVVVCFVPSSQKHDSEDSSGVVNTEQDETEEYIEPIIWYEDLTHDRVDERIEVDLNNLNPAAPNAETVKVYSGVSDELIWSGHADEVHAGWNGFYIYSYRGKAYILEWKPYMSTGMAEYSYKTFSLSEEGEEQVLVEKMFEFDLNNPQSEDPMNVSDYLEVVNNMLEKSYVLIDTDNGEAFYSKQDTPVTREFDANSIVQLIYEAQDRVWREKRIFTWYEDLTHDGKDERIVVDVNDIDDGSDPEAKQVCVYSGIDSSLIWSGYASTVHGGENGYYIYKNPEDAKAYFLQWHPYTNNEQSEYSYKVFSLSEVGEEQVLKEEKIEFSFVEPKDKDALNVSYYLEGVNELLAESYVLIDTNNVDLLYSQQDKPVTREFDIAKIIEEIYYAVENQELLNGEHIIWYEDLTHDGIDDRIEVDINHLDVNGEDAGWLPYYEPQTVMVYSGQTYRLIWSAHTDLVHAGNDGYHIYTNPLDGKAYILQWRPDAWTGWGDYEHRVFSLSETGEVIVIDEGGYCFNFINPEFEDVENVEKYLEKVNQYLRNSYVLIDTFHGVDYSEQDTPVAREFEAEELVNELEYFWKLNQNN